MTERSASSTRWIFAAVVASAAILFCLYWNAAAFGVAVSSSESRPVLLRDAEWRAPGSARLFRERFRPGSSEAELLAWLETNRFAIDRGAGRADRRVQSLPYNERLEVTWAADPARRLTSAAATVSEAGCL